MSEETEGTFLVTHADDDAAVLRDVDAGRVYTLADNPGVEPGDVLDATLASEPPMDVAWRVVKVADRHHVEIEKSSEPPTAQERTIAADQSVGELTRRDREGSGELHVLTVPADETADVVADVREDDATLTRAARMDDVTRVEIRAEDDVVSVRYLP